MNMVLIFYIVLVYTWQCGLRYTGINLQTLQDKDMILLLEKKIRGGLSSVMGDRHVISIENKKILYKDANTLYGRAMSEPLPYGEIKFDNNVKLEDILNTPDDNNIGYFIEFDLKYPDIIKEKTNHFPFAPVNKKTNPEDFSDYMKESNPDTYTQTKNLICDWTDKKNFSFIIGCYNFMLDMERLLRKFIKLFHLNRVSGWRNIKVLIHRKETRLKTILRKTSISY